MQYNSGKIKSNGFPINSSFVNPNIGQIDKDRLHIVLKLFGVRIVDLIKIVIAYFIICLILSLLGLSLPSIPALLKWIKDVVVQIYNSDFVQNFLSKLAAGVA